MADKIKNATLLGSVVAALLASACCLGSFFFAFVGISGAGFLLTFEQYRPILTLIVIILLGVAGYFTYRRKPADGCASGSYCAKPRSDRINKFIFWIVVIAVVLAITSPVILGWMV